MPVKDNNGLYLAGVALACVLLAQLFGCRAWFNEDQPYPDFHPDQMSDEIFKLKNQDVMYLVVRGDIADHYGIRVRNLLQEDWDANVLNVWWVDDQPCPYNEDRNAVILEGGRCVAGVTYACNEIYVATNRRDPTDSCGTALAHEFSHCIRMLLGWDPDGGHTDDEFWDVVQEANRQTCN